NQILNEVDGVYSLSEPDVYTWLARLRNFHPEREAEYASLLRSCTKLFINSSASATGLKCRSQAVNLIKWFDEAFPNAYHIFNYRAGESWVQSWYRHMYRIRGFVDDRLTIPEVIEKWVRIINQDENYFRSQVDASEETLRIEEFLAIMWTYHMDFYLNALDAGIPMLAVRFDFLTEQREKTVRQMLDFCDLPQDAIAKAMQGYNRDSQEGTGLSGTIATPEMNNEQVENFKRRLQRHPRLNNPDIILPDSLNATPSGYQP
ncbi:MAG TPA: hypothetical protein VJZ27_03820, partial [Aggregatilineales bacterium]|nr:hypothetical protein [Aggregatilineales bacterium]